MNSVVIWCFLNDEQDELEKALGDNCFSIRGSTSLDKKVEYEERWRLGERPILVTKPSVMGWGMNWQHAHCAIFCGMDYSYEGYYQAVRRLYRFGQDKPVDIYRVLGSTEVNILNTIQRKQAMKDEMHNGMIEAMMRRNEVGEKQHYKKYEHNERDLYIPNWIRSV